MYRVYVSPKERDKKIGNISHSTYNNGTEEENKLGYKIRAQLHLYLSL
jgi:hypothetical protein